MTKNKMLMRRFWHFLIAIESLWLFMERIAMMIMSNDEVTEEGDAV